MKFHNDVLKHLLRIIICMTRQKENERYDTMEDQSRAVKSINGSECSKGKDHVTISKETVS